MRIATWNLERPSLRSWKRLPRQRSRMAEVDADIWALTETRASITPAAGYHGLHCPPHPARRPDVDERWVSIWSRWPLRASGLSLDPRGAVSAVVESPDGEVVIYGTVLPWANEKGDNGQARMWQIHYEQIGRQATEWQALRELHPDTPLVVAGDFNQDRDGSGWYGTRHGRDLLTRALAAVDLTCATDEDVVVTGKLRESHLVDHIAICDRRAHLPDARLTCWEKTDHDGIHLSDHPTVAIDLMPLPSRHRQPESSTRRRTTPSTRREPSRQGNRMSSSEPAGPWPSESPSSRAARSPRAYPCGASTHTSKDAPREPDCPASQQLAPAGPSASAGKPDS